MIHLKTARRIVSANAVHVFSKGALQHQLPIFTAIMFTTFISLWHRLMGLIVQRSLLDLTFLLEKGRLLKLLMVLLLCLYIRLPVDLLFATLLRVG